MARIRSNCVSSNFRKVTKGDILRTYIRQDSKTININLDAPIIPEKKMDRTYLFLIHVMKFSSAELLKENFKLIENVPAGTYAYAQIFTINKIN